MITQINKSKVATATVGIVNRPKVGASVSVVSSGAIKQGGNVIQQQVIYKRFHVQIPKTVWTITHNQNTDRFMVVLRDEQGETFEAKIVRIDNKTIEVHLATALSGYVDLIIDVSSNPVIAV
jgi:hypothetical protein